MLPALLLAWIVLSLAAVAAISRLNRARRRAALPSRWRARLERERLLLVDSDIVVVGRRLDPSGRREVVLDCDGDLTTLSIDDLLEAPPRRLRRRAPSRLVRSHEVARVEP
jgi:hypothetical protein